MGILIISTTTVEACLEGVRDGFTSRDYPAIIIYEPKRVRYTALPIHRAAEIRRISSAEIVCRIDESDITILV